MTHTTTRITAVALATAALCWHQASHAAATEAQLRNVTLYGNVSIQEDSTGSWGPWAEFEPTAAGNTQPVTAPPVSTDPYRPLAQTSTPGTVTPDPVIPTTPVEGACVGGSICGFGAFVQGDPNPNKAGQAPQINPFRLNGTVLEASTGEGSSALLPTAIQLEATLLSTNTTAFQLANSGRLEFSSGDGVTKYSRPLNDYIDEYQIRPDQTASNPAETQAINFRLASYVMGNAQTGWGVIGYTTSTADMAALRGSNAVATYTGTDVYQTPVNLTVNFGNSTWSGSWNGGSDATSGNVVATQATKNGGPNILTGGVGFTASGTVVGSTFSSNTVGTNDARATVTGSVQGAFFGPNAAAAGGVVDITKTVQPAVQQPSVLATPQAVPVNANQGYTGRYVAPFIATKNGQGG